MLTSPFPPDDCGHKHLIRLHCKRNSPLLCHDLNNRAERLYYDCCCCIEYQLGLAEQEEREREAEALRILRGGKRKGGRDGKEGNSELESEVEYDGVREWLDGLESGDGDGDLEMGGVEGERKGGLETGGERGGDPKTNYPYRNATGSKTAECDKHGDTNVKGEALIGGPQNVDADGDVDMLAGETLEVQQAVYWPGDEDIGRSENKERKEGEEEDILEGMADGPF